MTPLQYFVTMIGAFAIVGFVDAVVLTVLENLYGKGSFQAKSFGRPVEGLLAFYAVHTLVMGWA